MDLKPTVLVVEDNDTVRKLMGMLFRLDGFEVVACADGAQALECMRGGAGAHLVVTDLNLGPDMDGIELAESMRAVFPSIRILYVSGDTESERLRSEILSGHAAFLLKPFKPQDLTRTARALLQGVSEGAASFR